MGIGGGGGGGGVISDNSKDNKTMLGGFSDASLMPNVNQPKDDLTFANNNSSLIGGKADEVGMNLKLQ